MKCPYCKSEQSYCIDSRQLFSIRRRRYKCASCGERYNTEERVVREELDVDKLKADRKE